MLLAVAPVFFAKGLTATYLHPMVLAFALAVLASMVVAVTFTPAIGMLLFDRGSAHGADGRAIASARCTSGWSGARSRCRRRGDRGHLRRRAARDSSRSRSSIQPAPPRFKDRNLVVHWNGPPGAGLNEMDRITGRITG